MKVLDAVHERAVLQRRVVRLAELLSDFLPLNASVLDVGSGDGQIDALLLRERPDLTIEGVDLAVRQNTGIPVKQFDGKILPYPGASFDSVMFVDVLHHTDDPLVLLREAARVARKSVVLKDHAKEGICAGLRLRFMDYVGNARHGVALPFNYLTRKQWRDAEQRTGLSKAKEITKLDLYPWPAESFFGAKLHFIASYDVARRATNS
jgi:SAM-dependent methyltransferase